MTTASAIRLTLLVSTLAAGCTVGVESFDSTAGETWESFRARAHKEAWVGGHFIVDGDVAIKDEKRLREFWEGMQQGALAVNTGGDDKWSDAEKRNLTYCVSTDFKPSRRPALLAALEAATDNGWEAMADVNFIHVAAEDDNCTASNRNVVFNIRPIENETYLARAFFPSDARSSREVLIMDTAFDVADWPLEHILGHELGHTLGFRHEHTREESGTCFEDTHYRPLTPYDAASIMHYPQCNGSSKDLDWTSQDADGAAALYGQPGSAPPPPPSGTQRSDRFGFSLSAGEMFRESYDVVPGTTFSVIMTGSGDADQYVKFGDLPFEYDYDCRPYSDTSDEECVLTVPPGVTTANLLVTGYAAATFEITVSYRSPN